jgi:hypothetical protein
MERNYNKKGGMGSDVNGAKILGEKREKRKFLGKTNETKEKDIRCLSYATHISRYSH